MKKIITLLICLFATQSLAGVPCSVPFQLQNNTVADATQVMANYNALISCLANAAASGANNDITSLSALSTPITPAQGGANYYTGGISSGTNSVIISSTAPSSGFSNRGGVQVTFQVGTTNTGATTINVAGIGALPLVRRTQLGMSASVGGELIQGQVVVIESGVTSWILISSTPDIIGEIRDYAGSTAPPGWAFIDGSCQSRTTYADLFTVIGTGYDPTGSTCDSAHFALPDGRGRVLVGLDTLGTRITNAGSGCNGAALGGAGCGVQALNIAQNQLPNVAPTFAGSAMAPHSHTTSATGISVSYSGSGGDNSPRFGTGTATSADSAGTPSGTVSSINGNVTQQGLPLLQPLQVVNKIIKL